jgi:hypothetical protein
LIQTIGDLVPAALSRAIQALTLNKDCFELFGNAESREGRWNPATVLTHMFSLRDGEYGTIDFEYSGVGVAETRPAGFRFPNIFKRNIIQGTIANISFHRNFWNLGNTEQNAATILHELGHVYNFTVGSGGFRIGNLSELGDSFAFDKLIKDNCGLGL